MTLTLPGRQANRFVRVLNRTRQLHKPDRSFWWWFAAFRRVLRVIETDAHNICGLYRRQQLAGFHGAIGDAPVAEKVAFDFPGGAVGLECSERGTAGGEMADDFHAQNGWLK